MPVAAAWSVPPAATVTSRPTVSVRAVVGSKRSTPAAPWPTVRSRQVAATSTVTVVPSAIITSSAEVGSTPPGHGAPGVVELQLPLPAVTIVPGADVA